MNLTQRQLWKKVCLFCLCGGLIAAGQGVAWAEEASSQTGDQEFTLEQVVVTANRAETPLKDVTASVTVITQEMIQNTPARTVTDLLALAPGVVSNNRAGLGSPGSISMRGLNGGRGSAKIQLMIDGRPVNNNFSSAIDWNTVPLENIERIEVVRGPVSAMYGTNSLGGAINIITKKSLKESSIINTSYGTYGTSTASLVQEGKSGSTGYMFTANYGRTDGFVSDKEYEGSNYTLRLDFADHLTFRTGYSQYDRTNFDNNKYPYTKMQSHYVDVEKQFVSGNITNTIRAYQNASNPQDFTNDDKTRNDLDTTTTDVLFLQNAKVSAKQTMNWGVEYQRLSATLLDKDLNAKKPKNFWAKQDADAYAVFIENNQRLVPKLLMNIGGRYDHHSSYGGQFSPKFGLAYDATMDTVLKMNIAKAFKAPTFNDLYGSSGNPNLKPTTEWSYELGVDRQFNSTTRGSLVLYKMITNNNIVKGSNTTATNANMRPEGIEAELSRKVNDKLDFFVNYTYLDVGDIMTFYATRHKGNIGIHYKAGDYKIGLTQSFVGLTWDNDAMDAQGKPLNRKLLAPYSLTNIKITYAPRNDFSVSFGVDNLFNASYTTWQNNPAPGRTYTGSFLFKF